LGVAFGWLPAAIIAVMAGLLMWALWGLILLLLFLGLLVGLLAWAGVFN
jgi:hypothetical protein